MKKRIKRIISTILCIVMTFSILPVMSYAQESKKEVVEITEKRDQNSKTYLNEDGTYTTIMTAEALHYQDENGVWQEIDNRLESVGGVLQNKANGFTAKLPKTMSEGGEVEISKEGTSLKLIAIGVSRNSLGNIKNNKEVSAKKQKIDYTNTWKLSSEAYYPEVYEGSDVQYIVQATGIKENIIIKSAPEKKLKYKYEIIAEGVEGEKKEDGSIEFYKDGELEYVIPAPYMYDSSGSPEGYSVDIEVEFKATGKGKYMLTYTPSKEWLADSARVYPVTLDPTVSSVVSIVEDAHVLEMFPTVNFGNSITLYCHNYTYNGSTYNYETYVKFTQSPISGGVDITHASLHLRSGSSISREYEVYKVTDEWNESEITWSNKPPYQSTPIDTTDTLLSNWVIFDVTSVIKQAYEQERFTEFNGFMVKGEDVTGRPVDIYLNSSEGTYYPYLSVTYTQILPRVVQQKDSWCWAACMQMLAMGNGVPIEPTGNYTMQEELYKLVRGETSFENEDEEIADVCQGLKNLSQTVFGAAQVCTVNSSNMEMLYDMIEDGKPVIVCVGQYNETNGHFIVLYKADRENEELYFVDPWLGETAIYCGGSVFATETQFLSHFSTFNTYPIHYCIGGKFIMY